MRIAFKAIIVQTLFVDSASAHGCTYICCMDEIILVEKRKHLKAMFFTVKN